MKIEINRKSNNYLVKELNGKIDAKGALCETMYAKDLQKGYDMPIVAKAVANYFLYNTPILETLYSETNIFNFCKTQNVGHQFHVEYTTGDNTEVLQRYVRFYVSNKGGIIEKVHNDVKNRNNLCSGFKVTILNTLDDKRIEYRDINYKYYYNECMKIIDPIKLGISPNQKAIKTNKSLSGKALIKKNSHQYLTLFDNEE